MQKNAGTAGEKALGVTTSNEEKEFATLGV